MVDSTGFLKIVDFSWKNIGAWEKILEVLAAVALIANTLVAGFTSDIVPTLTLIDRFYLWILLSYTKQIGRSERLYSQNT